jgi:hypothetical protein
LFSVTTEAAAQQIQCVPREWYSTPLSVLRVVQINESTIYIDLDIAQRQDFVPTHAGRNRERHDNIEIRISRTPTRREQAAALPLGQEAVSSTWLFELGEFAYRIPFESFPLANCGREQV